jgi:unsaturated chondroitin disaccharide hydrolase
VLGLVSEQADWRYDVCGRAKRRLDASLEAFVNEGGSAIEFGDFDVEVGKMVWHFTILGAHDDSCWSRG